MPLRRRDGGDDRRTFELVESAGFDDDPDLLDAPFPVLLRERPAPTDPSPPGPATDGQGPTPGGTRRRRLVGVTAGAVLALVAGMLVVDAVTSRDAQHRLDTARGALHQLDGAPAELWTTSASADRGIVVLPGLLVTVEDDDAVAVDLDSGKEAWRTPVGDDAVCGSWSPWDLTVAASRSVVCVAGVAAVPFWVDAGPTPPRPDGSVTVTVLDAAGGVVGARSVETDHDTVLAPGPDGGLVRVERVGEPGEPVGAPVSVDPGAGETVDGVRGRDVVVTVEDAVTGAERWVRELPFQEVPWSCTSWDEETGNETVDAERLGVFSTERVVDVAGCGIAASFAPDGTRFDDPDLPTDGAVPLAGGRVLVDADRQGSSGVLRADRVLAPDGAPVLDAPGEVLDPQATDDPAPGVLFVREGLELRAYDGSGARLWTYDGARVPEAVHALASGTAVVGTGNTVVGLDSMTGERLWSRFVDELGSEDPGRSAMVTQAFTDGRCAILVLVDPTTGENHRAVALELSSGAVVWESEVGLDRTSLVPVQGRLLSWDGATVTALG